MARIGLRDLYYAILSSDPVSGSPVYEAPVRIAGIIAANVNPNSSNETLFADDGPFATASTTGQISLELNTADLDLATQAVLLGHTKSGGILIRKSSDTPPYVAIGFRSLKDNGKYRYTWLAKGKFSVPEQANETKGDQINFQTDTISGAFLKRNCDDEWERHADEDDVDYLPSIGSAWFTSPIGSGDTTPPGLTSVVPADAATAISKSTTVVWTMNEALALSTITKSNFMLLDANGDPVAGTLTVNAARTVVTLTPTAALAGTAKHTAVIGTGIKDLSGNSPVSAIGSVFTTVA